MPCGNARFDTLTFALHGDPLAALLKMPVLVGVKALQTFEKFAELWSEAGTALASSPLVRK